jgi:hypothetical protein
MDRFEKMAEEKKQLGREQNEDLKIQLAIDLKRKLTTTEKAWVRKRQKTAQDAKMLREKPCPLSKERNDSVHIRNCRESGTTCSDVIFLFAWKECPIFLSSRKNKTGV